MTHAMPMAKKNTTSTTSNTKKTVSNTEQCTVPPQVMPEDGGPKGPEPTRYGDWESKGKCVDF